jgi:glycosyltransferase involved in cell wall biosynthesis
MIPSLVCSADIGVAILDDTPLNRIGLPNKLFEYHAGSLPVIATNLPGMASILASELPSGLLVNNPQDPREIADRISELVRNADLRSELGRNGRRKVEETYNWNNAAPTLIDVAEEALDLPR